MANARGKSIDNTHLSIDNAEQRGFIHRDYIAHCFRWSYVVKHLLRKHRYKEATILDIGCGREVPLAKLLYSNKMTPKAYIGVDVNKLQPDFNFGKMAPFMNLLGQTDICNIQLLEGKTDIFCHNKETGDIFDKPTVVTCFEVLEHVEPEHTVRMLQKIREIMDPSGVAIISTPCFNGDAAANHVNEITYEALGTLIQTLGFGISAVHGTFASQRDIEPYLSDCNEYWLLKDYYDSNVLSTIFAPLFPEASRNALWVLTQDPQEGQDLIVFPKWDELKEPWTSSELWKELKPNA